MCLDGSKWDILVIICCREFVVVLFWKEETEEARGIFLHPGKWRGMRFIVEFLGFLVSRQLLCVTSDKVTR